ncbi:MAG: RNA-binding domain-containing protein [Pseudomonadota bacterium]
MKLKEAEKLELKKSSSELKEGIISIVSILNKHNKGELYFGIKNDGTVVGQEITDKTLRDISKSISDHIEPKIYPEIRKEVIEGKNCIRIEFSGNEIPYLAYGRAYMRVSDEDRQLSARELEKLILKKNQKELSWDRKISEKSIQSINKEDLKNYIEKANNAGRISFKFTNINITLNKLDLLKGKKILKAAEILFIKDNFLDVQAAVFAGADKLTFIDIKQLKGNLFNLLEQSESYIKEHINWNVQFGKLNREEIPEISNKSN